MFAFLQRALHREHDRVDVDERLNPLEDAARSEHVRAAMASHPTAGGVVLPQSVKEPAKQSPLNLEAGVDAVVLLARLADSDCTNCQGMGRTSSIDVVGERRWFECAECVGANR